MDEIRAKAILTLEKILPKQFKTNSDNNDELLDNEHSSLLTSSLNNFELNGLYTLGLMSSPNFITVSSQQKRAREVASALETLLKPEEKKKILIVGGGFSGVTLANHLLDIKNITITLLEKGPYLCHIQRGCQIRRLHKNIHNWPTTSLDKISEGININAEIDEWDSGTAGEIASFVSNKILEKCNEQGFKEKINIFESCNTLMFNTQSDKITVAYKGKRIIDKFGNTSWDSCKENDYDMIFFCTGFGVERRLIANDDYQRRIEDQLRSYWRNENVGQSKLYKDDTHYFISGTGDGAINDLFRILLLDYQQDRSIVKILNELKLDDKNKPFLKRIEKCSVPDAEAEADLIPILDELFGFDNNNNQNDFQKGFRKFFEPLIRKDSKVTLIHYRKSLNLRCDFSEIVNSKSVILYNRVLFYILWRFSYNRVRILTTEEKIETISQIKNILDHKGGRSRNVIVRHGAERFKPLMTLFKTSGYRLDIGNELKDIRNKFASEKDLSDYIK